MHEYNFFLDETQHLDYSLDSDLYQKLTRYMITKEKTKELLAALIEQKTAAKLELEQELKVLCKMLDEQEAMETPQINGNGQSEEEITQQAKQVVENIEFQGKNLSRIVRDIIRLIPKGQEFDKDLVSLQIKQHRPDLFPRGKKAKGSFDSIFWKAAKDLEGKGQVKANGRSKGRKGITYTKTN